jgi:threonine aldolase
MKKKEYMKGFASDNNAGVHPQIMEALNEVNYDHFISYGDDIYTKKAEKLFKSIFGEEISVYFVYNGTAANTLGITAATDSYHSVICADTAHINVDECGAPERFSGCKLLPVPHAKGKLTIKSIEKHMHGFGFEHHSQPHVISLTQSTEMGTVYTLSEINEICDYAHKHGLLVHMDGARIANAAAAMEAKFEEMTTKAGIDVLSFGGTKNGLMFGEAIVFLNPSIAKGFKYIRKQGMQLNSKMRFMAAQYIAYFEDDLWFKNAFHANEMARLLAEKVSKIPRVEITQPVESNAVFAFIPHEVTDALKQKYFFYTWNQETNEVRWMTSFDTKKEEIDDFAETLKKLIK